MAKTTAMTLTIALAAALAAQDASYQNSIGMKFALIQPGSMRVGKFEPTCPTPGGRGGFGGGRAPQPGTSGAAPGAGAPQGTPEPGRGGQGAMAGRAARGPADPRNQWTDVDYALCKELSQKASLSGFLVNIEKPYYMGVTEVTQGQWKKVMGTNPSMWQGDKVKDEADQHPVDSVTWADAAAFVKKLNAIEKTKLYRLPSEFEWEYAARAGSNKEVPNYREYAWTGENNKPTSHAVAGKKPNDWGLFDMIGNVWEWTADYYNERFFPDPVPPKTGKEHVLRGASFIGDIHNASVFTHGGGPGNGWDVGFRVVRDAK